MHQDIKRQWTEALRSGTYEQVKYTLHNDYGYCVLGVLCDLHAKATGVEWEPFALSGYPYIGSMCSLPPAVVRWSGLTNPEEHLVSRPNDLGRTFEALAHMIETMF